MHLQLVVNNDIQKATLKPHQLPPTWDGSDADRRAARKLIRAIEVRPGLTIEEALAKYVEACSVADFAATDEGYALSEKEVFKLQMESAELGIEAGLAGVDFGWTRSLRGAPAAIYCVVMWPRRLLKREPKLKPYKHVLHMLDV